MNATKYLFASAVLCLLLLFGGRALRAQGFNQTHMPADAIHTGGPAAAQAAVDVWLGMVDDSQYTQSWSATSSLFKKSVPQDRWTTLAASHRSPLGKMLSRKLRNATFSKTLPGAPDGQYVIAIYDTTFEHKKSAVETATAMLDLDGQWRVSGYFVK